MWRKKLKLPVSNTLAVHSLAACCLAISTSSARADSQDAERTDEEPFIVVEMFVSQSCQRCVPAAEYLEALAGRTDLIALGWHVDYWNLLATKKRGRWADPYSEIAFSDRQRQYNQNLRGKNSVYTPQAVIDGAATTSGAKREKIEKMIKDARAARNTTAHIKTAYADKTISFTINAMPDGAEVFVVDYKPVTTTKIHGGENAGETMREVNIVTKLSRLAPTGGIKAAQFTYAPPEPGEHCAILVQASEQGRILSSAPCPATFHVE